MTGPGGAGEAAPGGMAAPDLRAADIAGRLGTRRMGRALHLLPSCGSTSDVCAELAARGAPEGTLVLADTQTGGRGRQGRRWVSPPGQSLYLSLLLRPPLAPVALPPLTLLAGAALARAVEHVLRAEVRVQLKWPNDLLAETPAGPRKVAGILTEMATGAGTDAARVRHVVLGIGVNVNARTLPPEVARLATSLALCAGRSLDRAALLAALLDQFEADYDLFLSVGAAHAVTRFREHARFGLRYRFTDDAGDQREGTMEDVDEDGALRLRDDLGRAFRVTTAGD